MNRPGGAHGPAGDRGGVAPRGRDVAAADEPAILAILTSEITWDDGDASGRVLAMRLESYCRTHPDEDINTAAMTIVLRTVKRQEGK